MSHSQSETKHHILMKQFMIAHLIQAKALEIFMISNVDYFNKNDDILFLSEIFDDISSVYMDMSELVSVQYLVQRSRNKGLDKNRRDHAILL